MTFTNTKSNLLWRSSLKKKLKNNNFIDQNLNFKKTQCWCYIFTKEIKVKLQPEKKNNRNISFVPNKNIPNVLRWYFKPVFCVKLNHGLFSERTLFGGVQWTTKSARSRWIGGCCLQTTGPNAANVTTKRWSSRYGSAGCTINGLVIQKGTHLFISTILATGML